MVVAEMGVSFDYVLFEMDWFVFLVCYNRLLMYKNGQKRTWTDEDEGTGMLYIKVYDEANENWIDYVEAEKDRYVFEKKRNCFVLPRGK